MVRFCLIFLSPWNLDGGIKSYWIREPLVMVVNLLSDHIFVVAGIDTMESDLHIEKPSPDRYIKHFFFNFRWFVQVSFCMWLSLHMWKIKTELSKCSCLEVLPVTKKQQHVESLGFRPLIPDIQLAQCSLTHLSLHPEAKEWSKWAWKGSLCLNLHLEGHVPALVQLGP